MEKKQSPFDSFVYKAFWVMLLAIGTYAARQMTALTDSSVQLNEKVAVLIVSFEDEKRIVNDVNTILKDHDLRIVHLERVCRVRP